MRINYGIYTSKKLKRDGGQYRQFSWGTKLTLPQRKQWECQESTGETATYEINSR